MTDALGPSAFLASLEIGGPYRIPDHISPDTLRSTWRNRRFAAMKFVIRTEDGAACVYRVERDEAHERERALLRRAQRRLKHDPNRQETEMRKGQHRIEDRLAKAKVGDRISLAKNEYGIRARAAVFSRNTGRQFAITEIDGVKHLVRRG